MVSKARLIAFEGVDGAGKSTALARVADALTAQGLRVFLPRLGKEHSSRPTRKIRELTRDPRNLELSARAELLMYCAREAQVLGELVRPALASGHTVLIDRSLLTPIVLGRSRGLAAAECEAAAAVASAGLEPDLTLVFDVHPRTSRLRKRIEKVRTHTLGSGGRKGLAGSAFKERVRDLYSAIAAERGYPLFHVERATREQLAERVVRCVLQGQPPTTSERESDRTPLWELPTRVELDAALASLPSEVALFMSHGLRAGRRARASAAANDPALVAWALDAEDPLREQLLTAEPEYALAGWTRKPLSGPDDPRLQLAEQAPAACVLALKHVNEPAADAVRERCATRVPDAVLASLSGRSDAWALALRKQLWRKADPDAAASAIMHDASEEAWQLRAELFADDPVAGIRSLRGLSDARAQAYLERYAEHAPRAVLAALHGRSDAAAHALRERLFETGREVIDSIRGQSDAGAFALRERGLERWPSTVLHSLIGLPQDERVASIRKRCNACAGTDVHLLRREVGLDEYAALPAWCKRSGEHGLDEEVLSE